MKIVKFLGNFGMMIVICFGLGVGNAVQGKDTSLYFLCIVMCYCAIKIVEAIEDKNEKTKS